MIKKILITILILLITIPVFIKLQTKQASSESRSLWQFTAIDTMKYSRDLSREKLTDPLFDRTIDQQMQDIAQTGATYVAIATPYDDEFLPMLKRWVASARSHNLHVWFRGNFSGWEGWFSYGKISRAEHMEKTKAFISNHPDLFQDGDVFTACPECENGGPGDPRRTGDVKGFRQFMINEYALTNRSFATIQKRVTSNYDSMNYDVAKLIMDRQTTQTMDDVVTIDHYVKSPDKMISDIHALSQSSGGKIVIGEFGAPIPDIHGFMTEKEQADWLSTTLTKLAETPEVIGVNYWTSFGGSTALWSDNNTPHFAVKSLSNVYKFQKVTGLFTDAADSPLSNVKAVSNTMQLYSDRKGQILFPFSDVTQIYTIVKEDYKPINIHVSNTSGQFTVVLEKIHESMLFKINKFLHSIKILF